MPKHTHPVRIYHITASWEKDGKYRQKDVVIVAASADAALAIAHNRVPMSLTKTERPLSTDQVTFRVRDMGFPRTNTTYYTGPIVEVGNPIIQPAKIIEPESEEQSAAQVETQSETNIQPEPEPQAAATNKPTEDAAMDTKEPETAAAPEPTKKPEKQDNSVIIEFACLFGMNLMAIAQRNKDLANQMKNDENRDDLLETWADNYTKALTDNADKDRPTLQSYFSEQIRRYREEKEKELQPVTHKEQPSASRTYPEEPKDQTQPDPSEHEITPETP